MRVKNDGDALSLGNISHITLKTHGVSISHVKSYFNNTGKTHVKFEFQ
jgi:hypothetical protein